jgi:hypothetical protein
MSQEQKADDEVEETAVPDVDIVGETVEGIGEAGARVLPHPQQTARPAEEPHHARPRQDQGEYHIGGARGPQDPGPWGSDEAVRNEPAWGSSEGNPMDEGSE